jgi:hypothetical protein
MTVVVLLALTITAALEVDAPVGCVDLVEVDVALQEMGGLDPAERVAVSVTRRLDEYVLTVDIALLEAPALHREVPLRPPECRDVADLVAVLVHQQRRAALESRLVRPATTPASTDTAPTTPTTPTIPTTPTTPTGRGRQTPVPAVDPPPPGPQMLDDSWGPCDGPARCGGWRASAGLGAAIGLGQRAAVDAGWDIGLATVLLQGSAVDSGTESGSELRGDVAIGAAWRSTILEQVELSGRALIGVGGTSGGTRPLANSSAPCVVDDAGDPIVTGPDEHLAAATMFVAPSVAVRARYGYVFVEVGTFWHVLVDVAPVTYFAVGLAPLGM